MKRTITTLIMLAMTVTVSFSQNVFYPTKQGTVLEYANYDAKGGLTGYTKQVVSQVSGSADDMTVTCTSTVLDKDREPMMEGIATKVDIIEGDIYYDVKSMFSSLPEGTVTFTGDGMIIPAKLTVGEKLPVVAYSMVVQLGFIRMRTDVKNTDTSVLAQESVTTPAGTFDCYKVKQTNEVSALKKTAVTTTTMWIAKGVGIVKQEVCDDKDRPTGSMLLTALTAE